MCNKESVCILERERKSMCITERVCVRVFKCVCVYQKESACALERERESVCVCVYQKESVCVH